MLPRGLQQTNTLQGPWVFSVQRSRSEQRHHADPQGEAETPLASSRTLVYLEGLLLTCGLVVHALTGESLNTSRMTDSLYGNWHIPPLSLLVPEDDGAVPNSSSPPEQNDLYGKMASQLYPLFGAGAQTFCDHLSLRLLMSSLPPQRPPSPGLCDQKKPHDLKTSEI